MASSPATGARWRDAWPGSCLNTHRNRDATVTNSEATAGRAVASPSLPVPLHAHRRRLTGQLLVAVVGVLVPQPVRCDPGLPS